MSFYYTEPIKEQVSANQHWVVEKRERGTHTLLERYPFHGENAAWDFLKTITITINGIVAYRGK